jgi:hypothetical protein
MLISVKSIHNILKPIPNVVLVHKVIMNLSLLDVQNNTFIHKIINDHCQTQSNKLILDKIFFIKYIVNSNILHNYNHVNDDILHILSLNAIYNMYEYSLYTSMNRNGIFKSVCTFGTLRHLQYYYDTFGFGNISKYGLNDGFISCCHNEYDNIEKCNFILSKSDIEQYAFIESYIESYKSNDICIRKFFENKVNIDILLKCKITRDKIFINCTKIQLMDSFNYFVDLLKTNNILINNENKILSDELFRLIGHKEEESIIEIFEIIITKYHKYIDLEDIYSNCLLCNCAKLQLFLNNYVNIDNFNSNTITRMYINMCRYKDDPQIIINFTNKYFNLINNYDKGFVILCSRSNIQILDNLLSNAIKYNIKLDYNTYINESCKLDNVKILDYLIAKAHFSKFKLNFDQFIITSLTHNDNSNIYNYLFKKAKECEISLKINLHNIDPKFIVLRRNNIDDNTYNCLVSTARKCGTMLKIYINKTHPHIIMITRSDDIFYK